MLDRTADDARIELALDDHSVFLYLAIFAPLRRRVLLGCRIRGVYDLTAPAYLTKKERLIYCRIVRLGWRLKIRH